MTKQLSKEGLPICPEVCHDCESGNHVFHEILELGGLRALKYPFSPGYRIFGDAQDLDFLKWTIEAAANSITNTDRPDRFDEQEELKEYKEVLRLAVSLLRCVPLRVFNDDDELVLGSVLGRYKKLMEK